MINELNKFEFSHELFSFRFIFSFAICWIKEIANFALINVHLDAVTPAHFIQYNKEKSHQQNRLSLSHLLTDILQKNQHILRLFNTTFGT